VGNRAEFTADDIGFTRAIIDSEVEADTYRAKAVAAICASQDPEYLDLVAKRQKPDKQKYVEKWQEIVDDSATVAELDAVFHKQSVVEKDAERLGESLSTRFALISKLVGNKFDITSLWPALKPLASPSLAPTGTSDSTTSKSSGS